jgi:glutaconate CoA-transferase, subunit B
VRDNTGFAFDVPERIGATPLPDRATLDELRGPVAQELARIYPNFTQAVFAQGGA